MMSNHKGTSVYDINFFWQIICRRKWIIVLPLLVTMPVSAILYLKSPKVYSAETLILVIAQRIPDNYVKSTVIATVQERLVTIRQEIFSRTRLEKVIDKYNLYADMLGKVPMEGIVEKMKQHIQLNMQGSNAFTLSYQHQDPLITMQVTNTLAQLFIEENLKNREKIASNTTQFLIEEAKKLEKTLVEKEKVMSVFRAENMGKMPEDRDTNLNVINQLISEIDTLSTQLSGAESRKISLQQQLNTIDPVSSLLSGNGNRQASTFLSPLASQLSSAREQLFALRQKYTYEHPEIKSLQREIARLENLLGSDSASGRTVEPEKQFYPNPAYREIKLALNEIDREISQKKLISISLLRKKRSTRRIWKKHP